MYDRDLEYLDLLDALSKTALLIFHEKESQLKEEGIRIFWKSFLQIDTRG